MPQSGLLYTQTTKPLVFYIPVLYLYLYYNLVYYLLPVQVADPVERRKPQLKHFLRPQWPVLPFLYPRVFCIVLL